MVVRKFVALLALGLSLAAVPALAQPATQPTQLLKLHAAAVTSGDVHLYWYDLTGVTPRYLIERSEDGTTFKPVGNQQGGSATARYDVDEVNNVQPNTHYWYRLNAADAARTTLSEPVEVRTPHKNMLEVIRGQTTLTIDDLKDVSFWGASVWAATKLLASVLPQVLVAVLIFLIFYVVHRVTRRVVASSMKRANLDSGIHELLLTLLKWSILGFAIVVACDQVGLHITTLLTGISIGALAIGFAAQDTLANFIASILIFWDKPFKVGDWITMDGQYGKVLRVTFRTTRILMPTGDILATPNTLIMGTKLLNHSSNPINWVNVPIGIPTSMPIEKARAALLATCDGDQRIMPDPKPKVVVDSVNPDSVKLFLCMCITDEGQQSAILQDYLEKAKNALDQIKA
ncbi:MAG: mechanosensitive ion channel family protein [Tepidisphaeraceae bacterium]|jgi:small conductance mechanosensitive channel